MAFDYVIQWRSRRLGYCHSLGNIPNYWAVLKLIELNTNRRIL